MNNSDEVTLELGQKLANKRIDLGYTVEYVRNRLLLSEQQLLGLEQNNFSVFYNRNLFFKSMKKYAEFLSSNDPLIPFLDTLIKNEINTQVEKEILEKHNLQQSHPVSKGSDKYLLFAIVILIILILLITVNELRS